MPSVNEAPMNNTIDDDEIDLLELLATLWGGKFWLALFSIIGLMLGAFSIANQFPTFRADAIIQLEERGGSLALPEELAGLVTESPATAAEIEIIKSRLVIGRAVAEENLDWTVEPLQAPVIGTMLARYNLPIPKLGFIEDYLRPYGRPGEGIEIEFLQVQPSWMGKDLELTAGTGGAFLVHLPDGKTIDGRVGERIKSSNPDFFLEVSEVNAPDGRVFILHQLRELEAIRKIRGGLAVSERGRKSMVLELSYTSPEPQNNVRILDAITRSYVTQNIERSAAEADSSLKFIESQLPKALERVRTAENALNAFVQEQETIDLSIETENLLSKVTSIEEELVALDIEEAKLKEKFTKLHPEYQLFLSRKSSAQKRLEVLKEEVSELPETQREVVNLTRDLELANNVYTQLLARGQEVRVLRASTIGSVRIIDRAANQRNKITPKNKVTLSLSLVLGLMAGAGIIFFRSWMRKGIQGAEDLEAIGLPVFATINLSKAVGLKRSKNKTPIVAIDMPEDFSVEALKSLRTSLHFGLLDSSNRSILITSAAPNSGKTYTSVNLSVVAAQAGQRVCIVDADLRRGDIRKYFGIRKNSPGLAEYLAGQATEEDITHDVKIENLSVITSGRFPPNPSELLMRHSLRDLIKKLTKTHDLVVIDAPPALAVTDPLVIAKEAGMSICLTRFDETQIGEVLAVKKLFENAGLKLSGSILNGFEPRKVKSGNAYAYNYRYNYKTRGN